MYAIKNVPLVLVRLFVALRLRLDALDFYPRKGKAIGGGFGSYIYLVDRQVMLIYSVWPIEGLVNRAQRPDAELAKTYQPHDMCSMTRAQERCVLCG
jgi:hypothetical protein